MTTSTAPATSSSSTAAPTRGGIVLEDGQQLISQGAMASPSTAPRSKPPTAASHHINGTVTLAGGDTADSIQGVDFGAISVFALTGTNVGNAGQSPSPGPINNTSGGAININGSGTGMSLQFTSVSSTGSSTNAHLVQRGARHVQCRQRNAEQCQRQHRQHHRRRRQRRPRLHLWRRAQRRRQPAGEHHRADRRHQDFNGALTDGAGRRRHQCRSSTGGTVNFNGQTTLNTGANTAVNLTSNTGATINFNAARQWPRHHDHVRHRLQCHRRRHGDGARPAGAASNTIVSSSGTGLNITNTHIGIGQRHVRKDLVGWRCQRRDHPRRHRHAAGNGGLHVTGTGRPAAAAPSRTRPAPTAAPRAASASI